MKPSLQTDIFVQTVVSLYKGIMLCDVRPYLLNSTCVPLFDLIR